jgi:hypothetical protein
MLLPDVVLIRNKFLNHDFPNSFFMQKSYSVYYNLGYWFLLFIVLVFAGFYTSYFSVIFQPTAPLIHIHFTLMVLWIAMLIALPFLIKYKKLAIHRRLGKISYVLVPLVWISGFLMIRHSYYLMIDDLHTKAAQGLNQFTNSQVLQTAADFQAIALFWLFMFMLFYSLGVINRRKQGSHARYMLASALTLLGPTVDRIICFGFKLEKLPASMPIELAAFFIADGVLALLLWKDYTDKRSIKTLLTCLVIYLSGQVLFFTVLGTEFWQHFVTLIMKPKLKRFAIVFPHNTTWLTGQAVSGT